MKRFFVFLLLVASTQAFADGPGGGGSVGSDLATEKCAEKTFNDLKSTFTKPFLFGTKFEANYVVTTDVANTFDKSSQRDILEFTFIYDSKSRVTGELAQSAGYSLVFADTCEVIATSGGTVSPNL